jgi:hypothetical protein
VTVWMMTIQKVILSRRMKHAHLFHDRGESEGQGRAGILLLPTPARMVCWWC